jgi:membrane fusion protein (multidrug efflux system)
MTLSPTPGCARGAALCALLAGLLAAGCGEAPGGSAAPDGYRPPPTLVVTRPATVREIRDTVEAIGTARANESVTLSGKVTDTVSAVRFEDGDYVSAGDVLIELTDEEEQALLAEAEANVNDARTQFQRLENLLAQGSVPVSQVDEARARYNAAEARYQSILARLDDRLIRAPFDGLLGFRQVSEGTLITPGTPITTLDDVSVIKLDFSLPEVYLGLVAPGQQLQARSPAYPDRAFGALVRTIGSRVDPVTRTTIVRAHIDNPELMLKPGMLMTVKLTTAVRRALMVPESALLQRSDQMYVFTVSDGSAALREIRTGVRREGWVELLDGLSEGEPVITEGVIKVRDGAPVRSADVAAEEIEDVAV